MSDFFESAGHILLHAAGHTLLDALKIVPFLFLTYLLLEFLEHKAGGATERWLKASGRVGPFFGGAIGMLPQCGFSVAASGLYTGRIITTGTLIAVYLSTSDEMLPLLISSHASPWLIVKLLATKMLIGVVAGFAVDGISALVRRRRPARQESGFEDLCERERCHCGDRFVLSALKHTLYITAFLLVLMLVMNAAVEAVGEERIQALVLDRPVLGSLLASFVGLIPNCASSVALTKLFLDGVISSGAMLSGLLINAGVALTVLFRNNRPVWDSIRILLILWGISFLSGILIDITPLGSWLVQG